jgi:hypothetical protein
MSGEQGIALTRRADFSLKGLGYRRRGIWAMLSFIAVGFGVLFLMLLFDIPSVRRPS